MFKSMCSMSDNHSIARMYLTSVLLHSGEWLCRIIHNENRYGKAVWMFLEKFKIELPYDPAILLLGFYPKQTKTKTCKDKWTPTFIAALFTIAKTWKQPMCFSMDEQIQKMWLGYTCTHTHAGILFSHKSKKILSFATTWRDLDGIIPSEISETEKHK